MNSVAFVQMPFAATSWPSLGLSLLKASLCERGIRCDVHYLNVSYSRIIGSNFYSKIALGYPQTVDLCGEWVFAHLTDCLPTDTIHQADYIDNVLIGKNIHHAKDIDRDVLAEFAIRLSDLKIRASQFISDCETAVDWSAYNVVGFTSMFQQNCASLALASRLKARYPRTLIVFGGANCEDVMGEALLERHPFIDFVFSGESDKTFPDFLEKLDPEHPGEKRCVRGSPIQDMDALPIPNYDDFFQLDHTQALSDNVPVRIVFESSRGCWWGEKHHCTFCGLNGTGMGFRAKTADRTLRELVCLRDKYGHITTRFSATDNIIPYSYFDEFLPRLASLNMDLDIFYETKANLTIRQLDMYKAAGLRSIQPGIESLASPVLRLMRKGTSAVQNIRLLRQCKERGITVNWNYLYGFPGEKPEFYNEQAKFMKHLFHLDPPVGCSNIRLDRFSPYQVSPSDFGIENLRCYPAYGYIYGDIDFTYDSRLAYYFVGDYPEKDTARLYGNELNVIASQWKDNANSAFLFYVDGASSCVVVDGRDQEEIKLYALYGVYYTVFIACVEIRSIRRLGLDLGGEKVLRVVEELETMGLLIQEEGRAINVAMDLAESSRLPPTAGGWADHLLNNTRPDGTTEIKVLRLGKSTA